MSTHPTALEVENESHLVIQWSDGQQRRYRFQEFLDHCPCATCREKRFSPPVEEPPSNMISLNVLSPEEAQPLRLTEVRPVGNYAYAIRFNQGCGHGIYTFEFLRHLGEVVTQ